ncbi:hypothetical protein FRB94_005188 [Tulasnella sp. JGI-2019a]|nr:hypothetical protein FRB93_003181 [Tulasnella sp. JGI-2019a]KAG9000721.1 hypothetical protein FRB94_005188 [Tulasnella sp. JGI-2019a]KAG9028287.1 hypothetical protein FRB95_006620 [Tulasnella sp. JGI-2019a]
MGIIDFIIAEQPNDHRLLVLNYPLYIAMQSVVVVYTCYITAFIAGRLWSVGDAVNKITSLEEPRRNRYSRAISALIETGFIQVTTRIVTIIIAAVEPSLLPTTGRITVPLNGISATLLVLQLNMFQKRTRDSEAPPLTTGASFKFAGQKSSSSSESGGWPQTSIVRRGRASTSMAVYQPYVSATDTQASGRLRVTFAERALGDLPLPDDSTTTTVSVGKDDSV